MFVRDRRANRTLRVPGGSGAGGGPALSADGRVLAFHSHAEDLVADDSNGASDVFLHGPLR